MENKEVDEWYREYDHPLKDVMLYIRKIILSADNRVEECIKWKSPTYMYKGNIASFNPRTKKYVSLMFHTGAEIPGEFLCLEGTGKVTRYLKIYNLEQAKKSERELMSIIESWCQMKDEET